MPFFTGACASVGRVTPLLNFVHEEVKCGIAGCNIIDEQEESTSFEDTAHFPHSLSDIREMVGCDTTCYAIKARVREWQVFGIGLHKHSICHLLRQNERAGGCKHGWREIANG